MDAGKVYKLVIPGKLPGLNDYIRTERSNRHQAAKLKHREEEGIILEIRRQWRKVRFDKPVYMRYTWVEANRKRDKDNIAFARKFIQDALVKAGTLQNDGWQHISGFDDRFEVDKKNPRIIVEIWEV